MRLVPSPGCHRATDQNAELGNHLAALGTATSDFIQISLVRLDFKYDAGKHFCGSSVRSDDYAGDQTSLRLPTVKIAAQEKKEWPFGTTRSCEVTNRRETTNTSNDYLPWRHQSRT